MSVIETQRLVAERKRHGYSQKYVALSVGVAASIVSRWESGLKVPSRENLAKLADLYGVTIDYLMGREESTTRKPVEKYDGLREDVAGVLFGGGILILFAHKKTPCSKSYSQNY